MSKRGILYIASGEKYIQESHHAARRAQKVTDLPISIVADREIEEELYDDVIIDDNPDYGVSDKARNLLKSPYDKTIYMDSDTFVIDNISDLYDCLNHGPLAVALDPHEGSLYSGEYEIDQEIPKSFPEYQTGVIVYRQTPPVNEFINDWISRHRSPNSPDQLSFRNTLYTHNINISIFPSRYNKLMVDVANGPIKILHDNNRVLTNTSQEELHNILETINKYDGVRIPLNSFSLHHRFDSLSRLIPYQVNLLLSRHGYKGIAYGLRHLLKSHK